MEKVVLRVLDKKVKASFDDVLQEVFIQFPNALTPDTEDISFDVGGVCRQDLRRQLDAEAGVAGEPRGKASTT